MTADHTPVLKPDFYKTEFSKTVWELPTRYQNLAPLGMGAYGLVCSSFDQKTQTNVAIKKFSRPFASELHAKRCYREICLLKFVCHDNIIGLIDLFSPAVRYENFNDVYIVTELMDADLQTILKTHRLEEEQVQFLVYAILRGLKYIHSAGIVHRDLKPSNLAMSSDYDLRILDFGLARQAENEMTGYVATRWYRAPEIMLNWRHYDTKVDVWSMGCIMAEMITGKPLFPGNEHIDQLSRILQVVGMPSDEYLAKIGSPDASKFIRQIKVERKSFTDLFPTSSQNAVDLLEKMLELDPEKRISVEEALAHPFFEALHDEADEPTAPAPFVEQFADKEYDIETWRRLCWEELINYVPRDIPVCSRRASVTEDMEEVSIDLGQEESTHNQLGPVLEADDEKETDPRPVS